MGMTGRILDEQRQCRDYILQQKGPDVAGAKMGLMKNDSLPNLNAEVARRIWPPECVTCYFGSLRFEDGGEWISANFEESLEQCQRYMLPALENRGLGGRFYDRLAATAAFRIPDAAWDTIGFAVLGLPPRDWCEAFVEVWGEE